MEHSVGYILGLLVGVLVSVGLIALLFKMKVMDMTFDERQERARGVAYKYGFFTLLGCLVVYGLSDQVLGRWCDTLTGVMLCICVALTVFASVCITKDAYLSLKEKPRSVMTLFAVIALVNLLIGGVHLANGELVENGVLTGQAVNLIGGVTFLIIMVVCLVNYLMGKKEDAE